MVTVGANATAKEPRHGEISGGWKWLYRQWFSWVEEEDSRSAEKILLRLFSGR
jgi:hypothetical protein